MIKYTFRQLLGDVAFVLIFFAALYAAVCWASTESEETNHIGAQE